MAKVNKFTEEFINSAMGRIKTRLDAGMTLTGALKEADVTPSNYYRWKKKYTTAKRGGRVKKPIVLRRKSPPQLVTIPLEEISANQNVLIIQGDAQTIQQILKALK